ncbi:SprT family zinc-dependent metalloprotease [Altererythrobacter arenosus]|uniref:SprT family zinc-dependent metalloprotease n=1 Tax=Altererythrobacter arenosus TaxID=3032592 RepID=A0ABY8FT74_9SPHN|nr:SprT family zinc-dependent metalloprotease [Altererythrobacter sp. CAU 1644]WFL78209.1 SprT family zinc-dependent metalloprotease [Altererythrobacter sp. CAU 1644]
MIDWLRRDMFEPELELRGETVPIVLRRHPRARRLTLRLAPDGSEVRITLPQWARSAEAIAFAHARRKWLEAQMSKLPPRNAPRPGAVLQYRGTGLQIDWREDAPRKPVLVAETITLGGPHHSLEARLRRWFEQEAQAFFEQDVAHYCAKAELAPVPVALSRAQRRWGSCSDRQRIRLNWRLIQAPDHVRRSVVAHEVTHLVHFDHSPAFHRMLGDLFEDEIEAADAWLKANGRSLYASFG